MKITTVGLDLAKSVLTLHGVDEHRKPVLRKTVPALKTEYRDAVSTYFAYNTQLAISGPPYSGVSRHRRNEEWVCALHTPQCQFDRQSELEHRRPDDK